MFKRLLIKMDEETEIREIGRKVTQIIDFPVVWWP